MHKFKRVFSIMLVFAMVFNLIIPMVENSHSYAQEIKNNRSNNELFDEYYPSSSFGDPKNWVTNTWKGGYAFNGGYLKERKESNVLDIYTADDVKLGSTIYPLKDGLRFNFRKNTNSTPAEVYLMSQKEFKKDNQYKLKFSIDMTEGKKQNLNFRIVTLESGEGPIGKRRKSVPFSPDKINEKIENNQSWSHINTGNIDFEFLGTGKEQGFGFSMQGSTDLLTRYELKNFSLQNITPASIPEIKSDGLVGEDVVYGSVINDKNDKRSNYHGDIVHILVNGEEVGEAIVDKNNNWEYKMKKPIKKGDKLEFYVEHPESGKVSEVLEHPYKKELHKPKLDNIEEGEEKITGSGVPGDEIVIKDEAGKELGRGQVGADGKFEVELDRPIKEGEKITAIPETNIGKKVEIGQESEKLAKYSPEVHKPEITEAKEGEQKVTGNGVPGDEIVITDKDGNELGRGEVDDEGIFKVDIDRPLKEGEEISAVAKTGENESDETKVTVTYEAKAHKPKLDELKEGEKKVTGSGVPGDEIVITDGDGKELGRAEVDEDGKFEVGLDRPLKSGEEIIATPETNENKGTPDYKEVGYNPEVHKPEITEAKEGEKKVVGSGVPGDQIVITDENGNELGRAEVGADGKFEVKIDRPLKEGENITATPETDGKKGGTPDHKEVGYNPEVHKPEITEAKEGEKKVVGSGVPGDEIVITDENGKELGRGEVGADGKFEVKIDRPLKEGENITATPETDGKKGTPDHKEVGYNPEVHKPEITEAKEGEKKVVGSGVPGDEIVITDENGKELGRGEVGADGKFEVKIDRPLKEGENITATPKTDGKKGTPDHKEVEYNPEVHKPEITEAKEGEKKVVGSGVPGDEIVITDKNGKELGRGEVGADGKFEVKIDRPLKEEEEISAVAKTGENESDETKVTVTYEAKAHKPEIIEAKEGEKKVVGSGVPGDKIVIIDEDGNELGSGEVDDKGNFEVKLNRPLKPGEEIIATPETNGNKGDSTEAIIDYNKDGHKVEIISAKEGEKILKVKGVPGDEIVIKDEDGNELGRAIVEKGKEEFEIDLIRALKSGEKIKAIPETKIGDRTEIGYSDEKIIKYDADNHRPKLDELKEGEKKVVGSGVPGDEIVITDEAGKELGRGEVDEEGNFEVELNRPLKPGEEIIAIPKTGDSKGTPDQKEVKYDKEIHKPIITEAKEGEEKVTGNGVPGDEIVITDEAGKELGSGKIGADGKFEVNIDRPLKEGEEISAVAKIGENESDKTKVTVTYEAKAHKPEIIEAKEGEKKVTGNGFPGDEIVITDEAGNELGSGEVDDEGRFEVELNRPLNPGEEIIATPKTNGNKGTPDKKEVKYDEEAHKPIITGAKEGERFVVGEGIPGDEIVITSDEGVELGRGRVDKDGSFQIGLDRELIRNEKINASPNLAGKLGEAGSKVVEFNPAIYKPNIKEAIGGESEVKGKGRPNYSVIIRDSEGIELGRGETDDEGNFEIKTNRPLREGEKINATTVVENEESKRTEVEVTYSAELHKPKIDKVRENDKKVTGSGVPGDEIVITDEYGKELGRGEVDEEGKFEVELDRPLKPGEKIIATPETNGNKGLSTDKEVEYDPNDHIAKITEAKEGRKEIEGIGVPGDEIVITDEDGNELGRAEVDEEGNFRVNLNRPLKSGEEITATAEINGKKGLSDKKIISKKENHSTGGGGKGSKRPNEKDKRPEDNKLKVDSVKEGDTKISGQGKPDSEIFIVDKNGKEIANGKVDKDGNFTIELDTSLITKDRLEIVSIIDGREDDRIEIKLPNTKDGDNNHIAYIQGYKDKTVRPNSEITRQEVAAALYRLLSEDQRRNHFTLHHDFRDIKENQWSRKHIATLSSLGIVEGYKGEFRPFDNITRAELVTMVIRFSNLSNEINKHIEVKGINTLLDDIKGHWGEKNINLAESKGWIKGYQDGTFRPNNDITRAEFVTVVNNALNRRVKKSEIPSNIKVFNDLREEQWYYEAIVEASNSHYYERKSDGYEIWKRIYDGRVDW